MHRRRLTPHRPAHKTALLLVLGLGVLFGCHAPDGSGTSGGAGSTDRPRVAVAIEPYAWLVRRIEPDAEVVVLVAPGETPETFQPSDADTARLLGARLYLRVGVPFERGSWLAALERADGPRLVDLRRGIDLRAIDGHDHGAGPDDPVHHDTVHQDHGEGADPHLWLSPALLRIQARTVADALAQAWPARAAEQRRHLEHLDDDLDALDAELAELLAPHRGRAFLVLHPSWGYFADAYGLRQLALEVAGQTPSDGELASLRRAAAASGARTVFVPPQLAGPASRSIARALGVDLAQLDPLAPDVDDNLRRTARALAASFEASSRLRPGEVSE